MPFTEYAPEYSRSERIKLLLRGAIVGVLVVGIFQGWLFPLLREFSVVAHCRRILGINGTAILFYGIFVGIPLQGALLVGATIGRSGLNVLRSGQFPPEGEKVLRPTPIIRGTKAKILGYFQLLAVVPLLVLMCWGAYQADVLTKAIQGRPVSCTTESTVTRAVEPQP